MLRIRIAGASTGSRALPDGGVLEMEGVTVADSV
jgi:hypothetical protein